MVKSRDVVVTLTIKSTMLECDTWRDAVLDALENGTRLLPSDLKTLSVKEAS